MRREMSTRTYERGFIGRSWSGFVQRLVAISEVTLPKRRPWDGGCLDTFVVFEVGNCLPREPSAVLLQTGYS